VLLSDILCILVVKLCVINDQNDGQNVCLQHFYTVVWLTRIAKVIKNNLIFMIGCFYEATARSIML